MGPYHEFDWHTNPLVIVMDRHGSSLVNLKTGEVNQNFIHEDQAFYLGGFTNSLIN